MHIMSGLEYSFITTELSRLVNKHFNRIRRLGGKTYRMKLGSEEILCELGVRIHATRYIEPPAEGDKFTEKVNKELDNARLLRIEQINQDRILSFVFDKGSLVFEMFGQGNAILVRDGITLSAHKYESWSDREIRAGAEYRPPRAPAKEIVPSGKYIIVSIMKTPLGKEYALEALARAGVDEKTPGDDLSGNKLKSIEDEIERIKSDARPTVFYDEGKPAEFSLAQLSRYKGMESKTFQSLSEAADAYYSRLEAPNPKLEKLIKRLEQQKERLLKLREEEKEMRRKGDLIYERYSDIEELISLAKKNDFEELEKRGVKINRKERSLET